MRQVCVIGNSHIAAIKLGWDIVQSEHPDIKLTFFGSPGRDLNDLRVENGSLVPGSEKTLENLRSTSEGESEIRVENFDVFLIVALDFGIRRLEEIYRNYRSEEHKNLRSADQYISNACFMQAARGSLKDTWAFDIAKKLKQLVDRPILILPQPLPSEDITLVRPFWRTMVQYGDDVSLAHSFARISSELAESDKHILRQPDETKAGEIFTKRKYCEGAVRFRGNFNTKLPDGEFKHMNQEYGVVALRNIVHLLR